MDLDQTKRNTQVLRSLQQELTDTIKQVQGAKLENEKLIKEHEFIEPKVFLLREEIVQLQEQLEILSSSVKQGEEILANVRNESKELSNEMRARESAVKMREDDVLAIEKGQQKKFAELDKKEVHLLQETEKIINKKEAIKKALKPLKT